MENTITIFVVSEKIDASETQTVAAYYSEEKANACRARILREYMKEYDLPTDTTDPDEFAEEHNYTIDVAEVALRA
jgi:hypothetical protein